MMRLLSLFFLVFSIPSFSQVDVTFRVDMQYQIVSFDGIHLAGSMQGWNSESTPLSDNDGDNIWEVNLTLPQNSTHEFKFINGNSWGNDENVTGICGTTSGNRQLTVLNADTILLAYVFNSCDYTEYGCIDENALNYNELANTDDGSCVFLDTTYGCTDNLACNFNINATQEDSSCIYPLEGFDCDSNCIATNIDWVGDQNNDGFTSVDTSTNLAYITIESYPNIGNAIISINNENFNMNYTDWGNNAHWYIELELIPNSIYNWSVEITNLCASTQIYSSSFTTDCLNIIDGNTLELGCGCGEDEPQPGYDCDGNCIEDSDFDGICDEFEILGCTDTLAINFDSNATDDDGSCKYIQTEGCMDEEACNFNPNATINDNSCIYFNLNEFNDTNLCSSSTIEIFINNNYENYLWSTGDTTNSIQISQAGIYYVTVTDEFGCQSSDTLYVSYTALPYVDIGDIFELCPDSSIEINLNNYWSSTIIIDFESGDTISDIIPYNLSNPGLYKLIVTDSLGCAGYDVFEVINTSLPTANFEYTFNNNLLSLNNFSLDANNYLWEIINHQNIIQDTLENTFIEVELCYNDTIMLTAENNCGYDTMISIFNPTKLDDIDSEFSVYPNPFVDNVNVYGFEKFNQFILLDLNGKEIIRGDPSKFINLNNLSSGQYNLILKNENKLNSIKLFKH